MPKGREKAGKGYTYADYLTWPEDQRWELIDGEAFDMSPSPGMEHQYVVGRLYRFFDEFFEGKTCHPFVAPFEIRFPKVKGEPEKKETVLIPDVSIVCDPKKLTSRGYQGAPDLVVEVLSPGTASHDQIRKRRIYESRGVKEFWLIHPLDRVGMIFRRVEGGGFGSPEYIADSDRIEVRLFPGLFLDFSRIFPPQEKIVRERPATYRSAED